MGSKDKLQEIKSKHDEKYSALQDKLFVFVYSSSMRDATLQQAYKGEKKELWRDNDAKKAVKEYIEQLLANNLQTQDLHDAYFLKTAEKVCNALNKANSSDTFTFGNAQKLINMAAKHFYLMCYENIKELRDSFRWCHCPMDSIMLKWVWQNYQCIQGGTVKDRRERLGKDFQKSWGQEDFKADSNEIPKRYKKYQKVIREWSDKVGCYPIEFDFYVWRDEE